MDAFQEAVANPLGMDEACENCDLCEHRARVVHGYGDVGADFVFVGEMPGEAAEQTGVPFASTELWDALLELGFAESEGGDDPGLENGYLTYVTRCRHPDRGPRDAEIGACEPFLTADVRMINPEVLIPVGETALRALAAEHTTDPVGSFDPTTDHARPIRGRGFELLPIVAPGDWTAAQRSAFIESMRTLLGRDYRQQKGRRGAADRERSE